MARNQHKFMVCVGANVPYDPDVLSPLDKALRELKAQHEKVIGFKRVGDKWLFKCMDNADLSRS